MTDLKPFELFYLSPDIDGDKYTEAMSLLNSKSEDDWMNYYDENVLEINDEILDECDEHFELDGNGDDDVPREWFIMAAQMDYLLKNL